MTAQYEKLLDLADFLDTKIPPRTFYLESWVDSTSSAWAPPKTYQEAVSCGFAGCAIGWACVSGEFPGLSIEKINGRIIPTFNESLNWDAVTEYFGIDKYTAYTFFSEHQYDGKERTNPRAVAKRIREWVCQQLKEGKIEEQSVSITTS